MKNSLLLVCVLATAAASNAAVVNVAAIEDNGFSGSAGGDLPTNNLVRVGTFDIDDSTISQNSANPTFLNQHFFEFGSTKIGAGTPGSATPGHFSSSLDNPASDTSGPVGGFPNKQIYLWVFNSANNSTPTDSFNTAFEQGVFYFRMAVNPKWKFRDTEDIPNFSNIELTDLTTGANSETLSDDARVLIGLFGGDNSDSTGKTNFRLVPIPEPASVGILAASGVALGLRRRRRG